MPFPMLKRDQDHAIVQDTYLERAYQAENNGDGNPIYQGYAVPGSSTSARKWQIRKLTYTATKLTSITWPQLNGKASTSYNFAWDDRATYTYS